VKNIGNIIKRGHDLYDAMTEDQRKAVEDAIDRVRMGESGYFTEIAELVIERDKLKRGIPNKYPECPECCGTGNLEDDDGVIYDCPVCQHTGTYKGDLAEPCRNCVDRVKRNDGRAVVCLPETPETDEAFFKIRNTTPTIKTLEEIAKTGRMFFEKLERENKELRAQLEAWQSAFGTTRLSHAVAHRTPSRFEIRDGVKKRVFNDFPETDGIFKLITLANHPETDAEHSGDFMEKARSGVEALERKLNEAREALRESNHTIMRLNFQLGQGGDDFPQNAKCPPVGEKE